jgi:hypothetical protein
LLRVMEITTQIGCRNMCVYCPQSVFITAYSRKNRLLSKMSFETFQSCIDKMPRDVDIHFGAFTEPWLNPVCTKMVLYADQKGHKIAVFTTLVGMDLSDMASLKSVLFKGFYIHLPSAEGYEKILLDENYFKLLRAVSNSGIDKISYHVHGGVRDELKLLLGGKKINYWDTHTRAGNVKDGSDRPLERKRGIIGCKKNPYLYQNVLLPNGDVVLCCMDFGMRHILGNLLVSEYESLFQSEEFLKVKNGQQDESSDILCRYCDGYAYSVSLFQRIRAFRWPFIRRDGLDKTGGRKFSA